MKHREYLHSQKSDRASVSERAIPRSLRGGVGFLLKTSKPSASAAFNKISSEETNSLI